MWKRFEENEQHIEKFLLEDRSSFSWRTDSVIKIVAAKCIVLGRL